MSSATTLALTGCEDHYEAPYQDLLKVLETSVRVYLGLRKIECTQGIQFNRSNSVINVVRGKLLEFRNLSPVFERNSMSASDVLGMLDRFISARELCKEELAVSEGTLWVIDNAIGAVLQEL